MTERDFMRIFESYDGEISMSDFSPEELGELLGLIDENMTPDQIREMYFEYYDDIKDRTLEKHKWSD